MNPQDPITVLKQKINDGSIAQGTFNPQQHTQIAFNQQISQPPTLPQQNIRVAQSTPQQNISLPAPANPKLQSSWSTPLAAPPQNPLIGLANKITAPVVQPAKQFAQALPNSIGGQLVKIGAADISGNPIARQQASQGLKVATHKAAKSAAQNAMFAGQEGGVGESEVPRSIPIKSSTGGVKVGTNPQTDFADKYLTGNQQKALTDYQQRTMKEFGTTTPNIVSADEAKFIIPGFSPGKSMAYHEPASAFSKDYYKQLLDNSNTSDKDVLFTAGGTGAGKTSSLREALGKEGVPLDNYAAVVDTNLTTVDSSAAKIDQALKSGRRVSIAYVYRDPMEAFSQGVIPRAAQTGRTIAIPTHVDTHVSSLDTIQRLAKKYKNNPNVRIQVIDNSRGRGNQAIVPIDFLKDKVYNRGELTKALNNELEKNKNQIPEETYQSIKGLEGPNGLGPNASQQPEAQHQPVEQPPDFLRTSPNYQPKTPSQLADLSPEEQMALTKETPLNTPQINTARNSVKISLPDQVPTGRYDLARTMPQAVADPVKAAGQRWVYAMKQLQPEEQANFWRAVEKPNGDYSPELKTAIHNWRNVDDSIHARSQKLGGNTNYLTDHALHPWNLPEGFGDHLANGGNPDKFAGINSISRKYRTIEEGEKAGLRLGSDPVGEGLNYIGASSTLLRRRALYKSLAEADRDEPIKNHSVNTGGGKALAVSEKAYREAKAFHDYEPSNNAAIKALRTANVAVKSTLLSLGQFHPENISLLRAGPTLAARGAPIRAAKGVYGTFRTLAPGGEAFKERVLQKAQDEGYIDKAAQVGMPYGQEGYNVHGTSLKSGVGHATVFGKQMPMMHDQVARYVVDYLEGHGIPLDSPEAIRMGTIGNRMMGFMNKDVENISPRVRQGMSDWLLAGGFTPSKFGIIKSALTEGGPAGSLARTSVAANVAAVALVISGIGFLMGQKSDNAKDTLLRALVDPAAPTKQKDSKGNTIKERLPGTDTSDLAKLLGIKLVRNSDGHLGVSWNPKNVPSTVTDFARARLSPGGSAAVKLATNTSFAGKPLFDPQAPAGTKISQGATSVITGDLPIGLQGLPYTNAIKSRLPQSSQEVLNASSPGTNPLVKSIGSSFGLTPATDTTVGKGLKTTQFFNAQNAAVNALSPNDKTAWNSIHPGSKNPVTGAYQNVPSVFDTPKKAEVYLANPNVLAADNKINQTLAQQGQRVDPFFLLQLAHQKAYLEYQTMAPGGPDEINWKNQNPWYKTFDADRAAFFQTLPPGDPNKPKLSLQPPTASPGVQSLLKQYSVLTDPSQKADFINYNPSLTNFFAASTKYTNDLRSARGLTPLKTYPTTDPATEAFTTQYMAADKATRSQLISSNPQTYAQMQNYLAQVSLFDLEKNAAVDQLQGNKPNQTELKSAYNLGKYDIAKGSDGLFSINPQEVAAQGQSQKKPLVPLPKIRKPRKVFIKRSKKPQKFRAPHIKKAQRIKVQARGQLRPTKVAKPVQVVKLRS